MKRKRFKKATIDLRILASDTHQQSRKTWLNKTSSNYPTPSEKAARIDLIITACLALITVLFLIALLFDI